jgi:fructose 1,6-bisphosphate aldolase/phosphatase
LFRARHLRRHGPFRPHPLPMEEMEYTRLPEVMKKLAGRWSDEPIVEKVM